MTSVTSCHVFVNDPAIRFGSDGSILCAPELVSELPSTDVCVGGIVIDFPSFRVHCPLYSELCFPVVSPLICGSATLTVYVPSAFTPIFTFASALSEPVVFVSDFDVPFISFQVLPRSQEFSSTASIVSLEEKL